MYSQTHSCPNLLFHSPALVQVDAASLGNLAGSYHFRGSLIHPFPLFQPWPIPSGFIFTALAQASQLTSPPFYLVHSHQSSVQIRGTGLLTHGSYAQKSSYPPLPTAHSPGSPGWLPTSVLTMLQKHLSLPTWVFGKLQTKAPHLWLPARQCILSL